MSFRFQGKIAIFFGFVWILTLAAATEDFALEPATPLARLGRQTWTMENGLPQNTVPVLLQSRDGFLWAGTELGLARFDGLGFRVFDHNTTPNFPDTEIRCLLDSSTDGSLWVGTSEGVLRLRNGDRTLLTTRDGLQSNSIRGLAQTADGTIWVWTEAGLARLVGQRFQAAPEAGLPSGGITSITADVAGGLWLGTAKGTAVFRAGRWSPGPDAEKGKDSNQRTDQGPSLVKATGGGGVLISTGNGVFLQQGGTMFQVLAKTALPQDGVSFLDRLSDGTVAVASKSSIVLTQGGSHVALLTSRFVVTKQLPGSRIESMYADREGCLWVGTNRGLARISTNGSSNRGAIVQLLPPTDPLASNAIVSMMEDREGDLWVGTETLGLHILRDARFRVIGTGDGLSSDATSAVVQDAHQTVWIGTRDSGLNRLAIGADGKLTVKNMTTENGLLSNVILSLAVAPNGDVWVGTPDGVNRIGRDGISSYTSADGLPDDFVRSLLVEADSSVWIGTRRGLTHLDHGRFHSFTQADGLGSDLVGALAQSRNGDLWIATLNGLSRLHLGKLLRYTTADGLSSNVITALDVMPDGAIWIGTQNDGLNLWNGKRFLSLHADTSNGSRGTAGSLPSAIHAIMRDDRGHLWLASNSGLTRVDLQPLLGCIERGTCSPNGLHAVDFTTTDGLRSRETSSNSHPTACRANDGMLWFTTPRGVVVVDPLHFPETPQQPSVAIERFEVDDRDMLSDRFTRIGAGALRFQFDYAGLSFAAPQKLRYQYMLEGFDRTWTDAGTRRTAYYTNIPPARYRFRVRASLGDAGFQVSPDTPDAALYVPQEASRTFELLPHFYQTVWFRALVVLLVAALVLVVFRRRVLRVEREFRAVMAERNRIAREIHDTLAQGYVGISLQLEILGELLRHSRADAAAKHLAVTQELVREGLDDARQSIWALRSHDSGEQTLPIRLRRLAEQAGANGLTANLEVHGAYRALSADAEQEILRIAQEAVHNVKKHAAASRLSVRLVYGERALALTVADDGKGFATDARTLASDGHYGLTGMRERASLIRAEIEILSEPGKGTTIKLSVPAPEARGRLTGPDESGVKHSDKFKEQ
jgi:signal transduction histidine kinase/ligand-binding sensor domain-containing protein